MRQDCHRHGYKYNIERRQVPLNTYFRRYYTNNITDFFDISPHLMQTSQMYKTGTRLIPANK